MASTKLYRYRVNGVIDTNNTVMANLEALGNSAGTWLTYDTQDGKWAIVINRARAVDAYFDDDNIVGSINVNGTGLDNFYNSVEVQFPHRDLNDQADWINIEIPDEDRNPNEPDKTLTLNYPLVNEPVQAQMLGLIELKQSRVDLIVNFTTDFSAINTAAGDVIAITNTVYGWDEKEFRVISVTESENESGITLQITALEYDSAVYSTDDLTRYLRTNEDGIIAIGAIGQPGTPEVTKFETVGRPRFIVETTVPDNTDPDTPGGIVEGMEFWIYSIPSGELPTWEVVDDDTRSYTLYQTINPASGSVLTAGDTITLDMDNFDPGNFLVKTRAVNSVTTGPFSDHSGLVEYTPVQTTDAINPSSKVVDANGNNIVGALTASGLLALLKGLMADGNNTTSSGSIMNKIFSVFKSQTGSDIVKQSQDNPYVSIAAKYIVITYTFTAGTDLDTQTAIVYPDIGQNSPSNMVGYNNSGYLADWPTSGTAIVRGAGDNTGSGSESVLIDVNAFKAAYPNEAVMSIRCGANWYTDGGASTTPVSLNITLYAGGTASSSGYVWTISGATSSVNLLSQSSIITSTASSPNDSDQWGDLLGSIEFNVLNNAASLNYADPTQRRTSNSGLKPVYYDPSTGEYVYYEA